MEVFLINFTFSVKVSLENAHETELIQTQEAALYHIKDSSPLVYTKKISYITNQLIIYSASLVKLQ
jgi:hypothetical protein